jgi:hypothetical protein
MALGAGDLPGRGLMRQALYILVAIHAGEYATVNRMPQLAFIHIQADLPAIHLRGQGGVGVAGKAIPVLELLLGAGRRTPGKQQQAKSWGKDFLGQIHAFEQTPWQKKSQ